MRTRKKIALVLGLIGVGVIVLLLAFLAFRYLNMARRNATLPSIQIILPKPNETASTETQLLVQASALAQGSPITLFQFYADGFLAGEQRGPGDYLIGSWDWEPQTAGSHTLSFLAYNLAGDANIVSVQFVAVPAADRDSDGIPDGRDECPDKAGPEASRGCLLPDDRDRDGVRDSEDTCPDDPGDPDDFGCPPASVPDRDRDGVPDIEDRCPDQPGLPEWEGCPVGAWVTDRDGDSMPDFLDTCPDGAGPPEGDGCPSVAPGDSDGDGVTDDMDTCIDRPGPPDHDGCPLDADSDRDGDGISDALDECPDEAGLEEFHGCLPEGWDTDADGDGVMDFIDRCDSQPGPAENLGCPLPGDRDSDGVPDGEDSCPDSEGEDSDRGCPFMPLPEIDSLRILPFLEEVMTYDMCRSHLDICDADGDGLLGAADECPFQPGPAWLNGCPVFPNDQDGDGIEDEWDVCRTEPGELDSDAVGCPNDDDRDGDGVPNATDDCPNWGGPPENHGCPRPGRAQRVGIKIARLETEPGLGGLFCYTGLSTMPAMFRIPSSWYLEYVTEVTWGLGDRSSTSLSLTEDGALTITLHCWGITGSSQDFPQDLGSITRTHYFEDWDGRFRYARGEGGGGWFEIMYRLCRGSCP